MMTKQDYIKFAEMIAKQEAALIRMSKNSDVEYYQAFIHGGYTEITIAKSHMIEIFEQDNPDFDADRFNAHIEKRVAELTNQ